MLLAVLFVVHIILWFSSSWSRLKCVAWQSCVLLVCLGIGTEQRQKACKEQKGTENYYASRRERIGDVSRVNVCEETECGWERNSVDPWRRKNDRKVGRKETWPSTNLDPRTGKDFLESSFVEGDSVFLGWNSVSNQRFLGIDFFFTPVCLNNTLLFFVMLLEKKKKKNIDEKFPHFSRCNRMPRCLYMQCLAVGVILAW